MQANTRMLKPLLTRNGKLATSVLNLNAQISSVNSFESDFQKHHIPINGLQKGLLSVGSAIVSIMDPYRHDMIACLGETTGDSAITYIMNKMENSKEGRDILYTRPRINSSTVDLDKLRKMPERTLGNIYINFLDKNKVTPDSRMSVQFIDDINLAYVLQRYREAHDLFHAIFELPTNMLGEVTVKWVEALQTHLPMCIGAAIFGPIRLKPKHRHLYKTYCLPWAIHTGLHSEFLLNIYFEKRWEQPLDELHKELNIKPLILPKK